MEYKYSGLIDPSTYDLRHSLCNDSQIRTESNKLEDASEANGVGGINGVSETNGLNGVDKASKVRGINQDKGIKGGNRVGGTDTVSLVEASIVADPNLGIKDVLLSQNLPRLEDQVSWHLFHFYISLWTFLTELKRLYRLQLVI